MATIRGGTRLANELARIASQLAKPGTLRVGFLHGATYPDGTSVAMVAAIQNWGAPAAGIPPRPFFSNMVKDQSRGWGKDVSTALKFSNYDISTALALVGEHIRGQLQQAINDFNGTPLKEETIKRKGFDKQLIDSSHMVNSADYEVKG